jgi:hypothetical protein
MRLCRKNILPGRILLHSREGERKRETGRATSRCWRKTITVFFRFRLRAVLSFPYRGLGSGVCCNNQKSSYTPVFYRYTGTLAQGLSPEKFSDRYSSYDSYLTRRKMCRATLHYQALFCSTKFKNPAPR